MEMLMLLLKAVGAGVGIVFLLFLFVRFLFLPLFRWLVFDNFLAHFLARFVVLLARGFYRTVSILIETEDKVREEIRSLMGRWVNSQVSSQEFFDYLSKVVGMQAAMAAVFLLLLQVSSGIHRIISVILEVVGRGLEMVLEFFLLFVG